MTGEETDDLLPMNPEGAEVDDSQVQHGRLSINVHVGQTPNLCFSSILVFLYTRRTFASIFKYNDIEFMIDILPQHFTIFRIKIVYGNNILKKANVLVYILFLLLSEFNSCIELSKTLHIFGINVSYDTINRILWNEGLNS